MDAERPVFRQVLISIGESYEGIVIVERGLVHAPDGPLSGPIQAAADTLPAWDLYGHVGVGLREIEDNRSLSALG